MKKIIMIFLILFQISCEPVKSRKIDQTLIGTWIGDRGTEKNCKYLSWSTTRYIDGTYTISFFTDPERQQIKSTESGHWWVKKGVFYSFVPSIMRKPDLSSYTIEQNGNTISFVSLSSDTSADCKSDYQFKDHKVQ